MLLAILFLTAAENLIQNPGFETHAEGRPVAWESFVEPAEGARARLDRPAHEGEWAAQLSITQPYVEEPYNNWSQNLLGDWSGQEFTVSGWIKTEEAGEAALWVQCWQRRPARVLYVANTTIASPVRGTGDWQQVETTFTAPENTDFMTVRCVLIGTGRAWFDAIAVVPRVPQSVEGMPEKQEETAPSPAVESSAGGVASPSVAPPAPAPPTPSTASTTAADTAALQSALRTVREDNAGLQASLEELQAQNEALQTALSALQSELSALREILAVREAALEAERRRVPALVPHGENPERYRP